MCGLLSYGGAMCDRAERPTGCSGHCRASGGTMDGHQTVQGRWHGRLPESAVRLWPRGGPETAGGAADRPLSASCGWHRCHGSIPHGGSAGRGPSSPRACNDHDQRRGSMISRHGEGKEPKSVDGTMPADHSASPRLNGQRGMARCSAADPATTPRLRMQLRRFKVATAGGRASIEPLGP
ncbi:hypothetical protein TCAP_05436 [Tolypocladium capitatum]|uniref:Uncharacterized protein n=1 Tax=Tolypocladium capitatum TaxID=45235 RepID=A0A2K3QAT4_9HYPO|nr:hypothetical protein TCAP_05436 [Tolypocladium capitatum]